MPNVPRQVWRGTRNWGPRPPRAGPVSCVVLHADDSDSVAQSIAWLQDPASRVSYHAIVGRTGVVYGLVAPEHRAWHAGVSEFRGVPNVNDFSVGLCLSNKLSRGEPFTAAAIEAAAWYGAAIMRAFPFVTLDGFVTHEECARPRGRKKDPGPKFDLGAFLSRVGELYAEGLPEYVVKPFEEL